MPRPAFPRNLQEFQRQFATEAACQQYLAACRWPEGFRCPRCGHQRAYALVNQRRWECAACAHQVSLTAGTILAQYEDPVDAVVLGHLLDDDRQACDLGAAAAAPTVAAPVRNGVDDAPQAAARDGECGARALAQ